MELAVEITFDPVKRGWTLSERCWISRVFSGRAATISAVGWSRWSESPRTTNAASFQ
jgi:hypothetical protein